MQVENIKFEKITKGQKTKNDILKKANQLFSKNGFDATGIDEIVNSLGLSSGVFYNHFDSKVELLKQVVEIKIHSIRASILDAQGKESATAWIQRFIRLYLSAEHKNSIDQSCPLITLSQELIKLNLHHETGLKNYTIEFLQILNRRLLMISPMNKGKANAILSLCVGAVLLARLQEDESASIAILDNASTVVMNLISYNLP